MPPKKSTSVRPNDPSDAPAKFTWEGANDTKLLLLTQGRYVKTDEYENLASAFNTTIGSIRNRISTLRVKQRNMYEDMGWDLPEGGAGHSAKKKRGDEEDAGTPSKKRGGEMEEGTPSKKARAPRAKKAKLEMEEVVQSDGEEKVKPELGVKEELVEDEEV